MALQQTIKAMLEKFKEFRDTISERVKSPFIGSLMITWGIWHWKVLAYLIYSEENLTISSRVAKVQDYLSQQNTCTLLWYPIFTTIGVLLGYSILNALGLGIKLMYDNWVSQYLQMLFNNNNITPKWKYDKLKRQYTSTQKEYDEDKEKYFEGDNERRKIKSEYEQYRKKSFAGVIPDNVSSAFDPNYSWENIHTYPDGK